MTDQPSDSQTNASSLSCYLMKAEPDSRVVKGKDVKFSVDDFEAAKTTSWEGVRNFEARNLMQTMKAGDKVLFYHSNTKNPGIAAFAEVSTEAYPDYTAWDSAHPYYDAKSDSSSPRWFMVDLRFVSRVRHFVSLALLRHLSTLSEAPTEMSYLNAEDLKAIRGMALLNKGRLSVQRVEKEAWEAISKIAKEGDRGIDLKVPRSKKGTEMTKRKKDSAKSRSRDKEESDTSEDEDGEDGNTENSGGKPKIKGKRQEKDKVIGKGREGSRRSKRFKKERDI